MHPRLSINTLCFAPDRLDRLIEQVARIGARGISPDLQQVLELGIVQTAHLLGDAALEVATLTHRAFSFATPELAASGRDRLKRTIEVAATIGAPTITMTTGGRGALGWSDAVERFAEAVAPCAQLAHSAGITLSIEPTSHLYADASIAHQLTDTLTIAERAGINVAIDLFACWFDANIATAIAAAGPRIALVQLSDYVAGDRALPCRAVPGDGMVPFSALIPAILQSGFAGWFDLEIIGPRLLAEGADHGLRRASAYIAELLDAEFSPISQAPRQ